MSASIHNLLPEARTRKPWPFALAILMGRLFIGCLQLTIAKLQKKFGESKQVSFWALERIVPG